MPLLLLEILIVSIDYVNNIKISSIYYKERHACTCKSVNCVNGMISIIVIK